MFISLAKIDLSGTQGGGSAKLQEKTAEMLLTETQIDIVPDTGYDGMSKVVVSHAPVQDTVEQTITANGSHAITPDTGYDAMINCVVDVNVPEKNIGTGTFTTSANGKYQVNASDKNLDGFSTLTVFVSVPEKVSAYRIPNQWNGSVDTEGLTALGWTTDQISNYQSLCTWMDYENTDHLVSDYDKNIAESNSYKDDKSLQYPKNQDFETQGYTTLNAMFQGCTSLKTFPAFNIPATVTNMNLMFDGCSSLEVIPVFSFGSSVTNCVSMFQGCSSLTIVPKIDFSTMLNLQNCFYNCTSLKYIPEFDFSSATRLVGFYEATGIEEIGNVIANNCTAANYLFAECPNLKKVGRIHLADTANNNKMFQNDTALESVAGFSYRGTYNNGNIFTVEMTNLTHFIMEDYINCTWDTGFLTYCPNLDYESIKSFLTAMSNTTVPDTAKSFTFNSTMQDQNNELQTLVDDCVNNKGWTISGLTITTETV